MGNFSITRNAAIISAIAMLAFAACTKEQDAPIVPPVELTVDYPAIPFTIQADQVPGQFLLQFDLDANVLGQVLATHNYALGQMMEFRFTTAKLHLTSPADGNYNALGSVAIEVASGDGAPVSVANLSPVPDNSHTLILNLAGANVVDLMRSGSVHVNAVVNLDGSLPDISNHQLLLSAKVTMQI